MSENIKSDPLPVWQNHTRVPGFLLRLLRQKAEQERADTGEGTGICVPDITEKKVSL